VKWLETRAENEAVNEIGFFGNQNTVYKPTIPNWRFIKDKLKQRLREWNIDYEASKSLIDNY